MTQTRRRLLTSAAPVRAPEDDRPNRRETARRDRTDHRADQRSDDDRARVRRDRPQSTRRHDHDDDGDGDDDGDHDQIGDLVPDPEVAREFRISLMGLWRWTQDETLDFPAPISIRGRNYRSRKALERFKKRMIERAIRQRHRRGAEARR